MGSHPQPHFAIFPFMSQGHIIPLLHLSRLLRRRRSAAAVTIFTTTGSSPPIRAALHDTDISILELPFPQNIEGVPQGVENTHDLPSMSFFVPFVESTRLMRESFEQALETLKPPVSCVVSDLFLGWTLRSAERFNVPRLVFFGMGQFSFTMYQIFGRERPHAETNSLDEPFSMPGFPHLKLTRNDFAPPFNEIEPSGPSVDFMAEQVKSMVMSQGLIVNTFYELEKCYVDFWNDKFCPKAYCVGPLCMAAAAPPLPPPEKPGYLGFLDEKLGLGVDVLYVAFGTQAELSEEQLLEISEGLEKSEVSFLWALKSKGLEFVPGFAERVKGRGVVVEGWVDQLGILRHGGVKGFLSHCGWNSVIESISAGVPLLALPCMAEQHMNARFVAEEAGVGLRMRPAGGSSVLGLVEAEEVEGRVRELMMMGGEEGAAVRRKTAELGGAAADAMKEDGSSMLTLDLLIEEMGGALSKGFFVGE